MMHFDVVNLGASTATSGVTSWQAQVPVTGTADVEDYGQVASFNALGVLAMPFPATSEGAAQCVVIRGAGNMEGIAVGARDTRSASMVGNLVPGDTALVSTHPKKSSMIVLKGEKCQAVMATKGTDGKNMLVLLDGKNDKIQITAWGQIFQMSKTDGISMTDGSQASISINKGTVSICGQIILGGRVPLMPMAMQPGAAGITSLQAPGIFSGV